MTAQVPDTLTIGGERLWLPRSPLEPYFEGHPDRRPVFEPPDSSNWRGYVARWTVEADELLLVELTGWVASPTEGDGPVEIGVRDLFPADRVRADWFTGEVRAADPASGADDEPTARILFVEKGRVVSDTRT